MINISIQKCVGNVSEAVHLCVGYDLGIALISPLRAIGSSSTASILMISLFRIYVKLKAMPQKIAFNASFGEKAFC